MRRALATPVLVLAIGCATASPQAEAVRVTTNPEAVKGCAFIGNVQGKESGWGGTAGQNIAENNAHVRLRENAVKMGADTVLLMTSNVGFSGAVQRGEGYRCKGQD